MNKYIQVSKYNHEFCNFDKGAEDAIFKWNRVVGVRLEKP